MAKFNVKEETLGNGNKQYHIERQLSRHVSWERVTSIPFETVEEAQKAAKILYDESVVDYKTVATYG